MQLKPIILAACLALSAMAQQPGQPWPGQAKPGPRISFSFKGGTVEEYLATLRAAAPKDAPVNVVVTADVQKEKLPAVEMTNTSVYSAVAALDVLLPKPEFDVNVKVLAQFGPQDPEQTAYGVEVVRRMAPKGAFMGTLRVYSVRDVLAADGVNSPERVSADTLLTAVKTALGEAAISDQTPPEVKFHPESALLIVRASDYQQDVVKQVVKEISASVTNEGAARRAAAARKLDMTRCEQRVAMAAKTLENLKMRRDQVKKLYDSGNIPVGELLSVELEIGRAESELIVAEAEREAVAEGVTFTATSDPASGELSERLAELEKVVAEMRKAPASKSGPQAPRPAR